MCEVHEAVEWDDVLGGTSCKIGSIYLVIFSPVEDADTGEVTGLGVDDANMFAEFATSAIPGKRPSLGRLVRFELFASRPRDQCELDPCLLSSAFSFGPSPLTKLVHIGQPLTHSGAYIK